MCLFIIIFQTLIFNLALVNFKFCVKNIDIQENGLLNHLSTFNENGVSDENTTKNPERG